MTPSRCLLAPALLLLAGGGCVSPAGPALATASAPAATSPEEAAVAIARVLDDWHAAASAADEARYFAHFTEDGVFLGTDATERWTVSAFRAYAHPHFANGKAWSFRPTRRAITVRDSIAWFDEDLDTPHLGPARGSGVVVRNAGGTWQIAQYDLSVPIPNERFKEVRALLDRHP